MFFIDDEHEKAYFEGMKKVIPIIAVIVIIGFLIFKYLI